MDAENRHFLTWADLPASSGTAVTPARWRRGRTWGQAEQRYVRPAAIPIYVTPEAHAVLRKLVTLLAEEETECCKFLREHFDAGNIGADKWNKNLGRNYLTSLTASMRKAGIPEKSTDWFARERCAARFFSTMRNRVMEGRYPQLDWSGECPAGLNVRIAAGAHHKLPVVEHAGGWLGIDSLSLGVVWSPESLDGGLRPSEAAYVECAHFEQRWHARFVFVRRETDEERRVRTRKKGRATA